MTKRKKIQDSQDASIREIVKIKLNKFLTLSGLSQSELARKLKLDRSSVSNWCSGKTTPDVDRIGDLCEIFGRLPSDFYYRDDDEPEPTETDATLLRQLAKAFLLMDDAQKRALVKHAQKIAKKSKNQETREI